MALTVDRIIAHALVAGQAQGRPQQGQLGTSTGINITPGSDDDGWIVPPPVRLADGTRVQLYKDGEALRAAYEAIKSARYRICLEVYIFASDDTGRAFADLLSAKAREGVAVYVIYDSFGSSRTDPRMFKRMRDMGCYLREFHPIRPWETNYSWRPALRDHRKLLLIDDHIAGLGGLNIGGEYGGSWVANSYVLECDLWRDNAIGVVGPAARLFQSAFANMWNYCNHGGRLHCAQYMHNLNGDGGDGTPPINRREPGFGLLASVPSRSSPLAPLLRRLFHGARRSIQMTMAYFAPQDDLVTELCRAARRGVRVQLMLPARSDLGIFLTAARSFYEMLMNAGVEIYERQAVVLHAKTLCIDGELTVIGSANLDYRSIEFNFELSALVCSREFGGHMNDLFHHDMRFAKRIHLDQWRHRPMWDRFVQWAVYRARYLL